jgi:hypothetical protein
MERDAEGRRANLGARGAIEWTMENNRAYALTIARLALQGETLTTLGLGLTPTTAQSSVAALEAGRPAEPRTDHDPRIVVAATMALMIGYLMAEDWIADAVGLSGCDPAEVRAAIDEVMSSMAALGKGPVGSCE